MHSEREFEFQSNVLPQRSFNFFQDIKEKQEYCDVVLRMADLSIPTHSIVIAAAIPYLRDKLRDRGTEKEVNIPEVDDLKPGAVQSMIEYAYHGKIKGNVENTMDLMSAACRFQMDEMRDACCHFLANNFHPENAMRVRDLARHLGCEDLVQHADEYIGKNFGEMCKADDFLNCSFDDIKELVKRDDLLVEREEIVYESVMKWIAQAPEREDHLPELISDVRLACIKPSYLRLHVARNKFIRASTQCRDFVDDVTNFLMFPDDVDYNPQFNTQPRCYMRTDSANVEDNEQSKICDDSEQLHCGENTENAGFVENNTDGRIHSMKLHALFKRANYEARKFDDCGAFYPDRQQQLSRCPTSNCDDQNLSKIDQVSELQPLCDSMNCDAIEEDKSGGIYAFHAKLVFSIQHLDDKTKTWRIKKRDFFTINTASVTGLNGNICFLDCENMCYYNPNNKEINFTDRYIQGRAFVSVGNQLYVLGGSDGSTVFDTAERFDLDTEEWSEFKCMENCREYACCVALEECLYVIGGNNLESVYSTVEVYDIQADQWCFSEPTLTGRTKLGAASLNGKIYICGGIISLEEQECSVTAEVYDPNDDRWTYIAPLTTARVHFTLVSYARKLYAVGGSDENDDYINEIDIYNPRTGRWKLGCPLAPELHITGAAAVV